MENAFVVMREFSTHLRFFVLASLAASWPSVSSAAEVLETDLCVYGGTSGGVVAAVQAARMGKRAVIIEPGQHLGGMTAGGLSWTDVGSSSDRVGAIGGIAREVYERIGARYGQKAGTALEVPATSEQRRLGVDFSKPPSLAFEPKEAEAVFVALANEHAVPVHFGRRLAAVRKEGSRIREIICDDGSVFRARVFLDATYEGDLLAQAGVSYTVGREANAQYGETLNGIQLPARSPNSGKFEVAVDPFVRAGDPTSGVLPYLLLAEELGKSGAADKRVQSYNYRVCLTDNPQNRLPIEPPEGNDPAHYELLARWIEARIAAGQKLTLRSFLKYDPLQNGKFDFNNRWPISTDFIGGAREYPEATPARRTQIAREHERYLRGFFHFLATSPRVPAEVRTEMSHFGLCRDEFTDNGGWPHQLYVREARRMASDFVMTEHHCRGTQVADRSIGLAAYGIDLHAVRRIVHEGRPINEGSNGGGVPRPYPIGYGALVPKQVECDNLIVAFALSASHVAFGSIRMEPVFMILSQSAATAAALAIDGRTSVQDVPYAKLRERLLADGQVLEFSSEALAAGARAADEPYDLVVYGGTSAAVIAAVHAKKMGKSVVIVCPDKHLGGLSSGGLGWTDTGNKAVIGGLAREFYHRVWKHYDQPAAWKWQTKEEYGNKGQGTPAIDGNQRTMWIFEPHVAEQVFEDFVKEHNISVHRNEWLDRAAGVIKTGPRITAIKMLSGKQYAGRMFIDATYEGDLMAAAGVEYTVGREARSTYDEEHNGVQTGVLHHRHHFGVLKEKISPYRTPGDPSSGVLPRISADPPGEFGSADKRVQAYCYRMCLTDHANNRVPFAEPEGYDPTQYELLVRIFAAGWRETFNKFDPIPNRKTDTNNHGPFSTDNIGYSYDYPEASYERRREILREHQQYQQGWLYFIANDPRVPKDVQDEMRRWGLAKDEFTDNDHWPHQIYVREARRMIGSYVMTEKELRKKRPTPDSVGMGSYTIDSHNVQRYITPEGYVQNEGDIGVPAGGPYAIAYGSLVPRRGQCENLLVPVCLSSSHIAFGSIRMEPVFMILGQSAATAAVLAIDAQTTVQDVPYAKLRERLLADGQVLEFESSAPAGGKTDRRGAVDWKKLPGIVVDDTQAKLAGDWKTSRAGANWIGDGYRHDQDARDGKASARFEVQLPGSGRYEVRLAYTPHANRSSKTVVEIEHAAGRASLTLDQRQPPPLDGHFVSLGSFEFAAAKPAVVVVSNRGAGGYVIIDAVQWIRAGQ